MLQHGLIPNGMRGRWEYVPNEDTGYKGQWIGPGHSRQGHKNMPTCAMGHGSWFGPIERTALSPRIGHFGEPRTAGPTGTRAHKVFWGLVFG